MAIDIEQLPAYPPPGAGLRGRGSAEAPSGRFERIAYEPDFEDGFEDQSTSVPTQVFRDDSKSIISTNDSPDIHFEASINPYRGCEHGCIYCYARPYHEYLGLSAGLDFETRIFVKEKAPELLRKELSSKNWKPKVLGVSGVTDCYQPLERKFRLTRSCLEVLAEFRNPATVITKNHLITRDLDVLGRMAHHNTVLAMISITTLDDGLRRQMEPRAPSPGKRLEAVRTLASAGIPCGVMMGPIIPGLTDWEIPSLLAEAAGAGARYAAYVVLRLPHGVGDLFEAWLNRFHPTRASKVLNHVRAMHDGRVADSRFGDRMKGSGVYASQIASLFEIQCRKHGLNRTRPVLSTEGFRKPGPIQHTLF